MLQLQTFVNKRIIHVPWLASWRSLLPLLCCPAKVSKDGKTGNSEVLTPNQSLSSLKLSLTQFTSVSQTKLANKPSRICLSVTWPAGSQVLLILKQKAGQTQPLFEARKDTVLATMSCATITFSFHFMRSVQGPFSAIIEGI